MSALLELCPRCEASILKRVEVAHDIDVSGSVVRLPKVQAEECPACGFRSLSGREVRLFDVLFAPQYQTIRELVAALKTAGYVGMFLRQDRNQSALALRLAVVRQGARRRRARPLPRQRVEPRHRRARRGRRGLGPGRAGDPPPHRQAAPPRRGGERNRLRLQGGGRLGAQAGQAEAVQPQPPEGGARGHRVLRLSRHPGPRDRRGRPARQLHDQEAPGRRVARPGVRDARPARRAPPPPGPRHHRAVHRAGCWSCSSPTPR